MNEYRCLCEYVIFWSEVGKYDEYDNLLTLVVRVLDDYGGLVGPGMVDARTGSA